MSDTAASDVKLSDMMVGFIGGGNMAQAIMKGLLHKEVLRREQFLVSAPSDRNLNIVKALGIRVTHNNCDVMKECHIVFLACKPYHMVDVMEELRSSVLSRRIFVPISVGTPVSMFEKGLPGMPIIRVMPSLPNEVGAGVAPYCPAPNVDTAQISCVEALFKPLGFCEEVREQDLDVISQLSGASCAWHSMIIEALADGAVKMGLPRHLANRIAPQGMLGAAKLILDTGVHPALLKDRTTSPGGTTVRGVHVMEQRGVRGAMMDAMECAVMRAREISKQ